jgi:hypothetical protein
MSLKFVEINARINRFLNISTFSSNVLIVWSSNFKTSILKIFLKKMSLVLRSASKSSKNRKRIDCFLNFFTKVQFFDFVDDFMLSINRLYVIRSIVLLVRCESNALQTFSFFRDFIAIFISEWLCVSIEHRSEYEFFDHHLHEILNFLDIFINFDYIAKAFDEKKTFFCLSQLSHV